LRKGEDKRRRNGGAWGLRGTKSSQNEKKKNSNRGDWGRRPVCVAGRLGPDQDVELLFKGKSDVEKSSATGAGHALNQGKKEGDH